MSILDSVWRKLVFFVGDIRSLGSFPYVTWYVHKHKMNYDEVLEVLPLIQFGDVGIHRDSGYLSNIAIPGFMKHGWIHTEDGVESPQMIEAISEGVIKRSSIYPIFSDFTIILSPKNVTEVHRRGACKKAISVIGERYDVDFKFDIEEELKYYEGKKLEDAKEALGKGEKLLKKFDHAFSCTELVSYAWWHKRDQLGLKRQERRGKSVILADDFLNEGWDIKWMSQSVTVKSAKKLKLHETGIQMIADFLESKNT